MSERIGPSDLDVVDQSRRAQAGGGEDDEGIVPLRGLEVDAAAHAEVVGSPAVSFQFPNGGGFEFGKVARARAHGGGQRG